MRIVNSIYLSICDTVKVVSAKPVLISLTAKEMTSCFVLVHSHSEKKFPSLLSHVRYQTVFYPQQLAYDNWLPWSYACLFTTNLVDVQPITGEIN